MKKFLFAAMVVFCAAFSVRAQDDTVRTTITDDAEIAARFSHLVGDWNVALIMPPNDPDHKGVQGYYSAAIMHMVFSNTDGACSASITSEYKGVDSENPSTKTYSPPLVFKLLDVSDVTQDNISRTELMFEHTYTNSDGKKMSQDFDLIYVPHSDRIIGFDFADTAVNSDPNVPTDPDEIDGLYAGGRGGESNITDFLPTTSDLAGKYSEKTTDSERMQVLKDWAGYGQ